MARNDDIIDLISLHVRGDEKQWEEGVRRICAYYKSIHKEDFVERIDRVLRGHRASWVTLEPNGAEVVKHGLAFADESSIRIENLVLADSLRDALKLFMQERACAEKLREAGLQPARKILLHGAPGNGKTMAARAIAGELGLPLYTVSTENVIDSYLGSTAKNLSKIFSGIKDTIGVWFFDEFDSLARSRSRGSDAAEGEMGRLMGSLLQFIERDKSDSIIVAATNMPQILDKALYRRFDAVLEFTPPTPELALDLMYKVLGRGFMGNFEVPLIIECANGLSYAEIELACKAARKEAIISGKPMCDQDVVRHMHERQKAAAARKSKMEAE